MTAAAEVDIRPRTLGDALARATASLVAAGISNARLEAVWLLEHVTSLAPLRTMVEPERPLAAAQSAYLDELIRRRIHREPLQYLVGTQEFCGLEMIVTPDVLIPRPETALLVDEIVAECRHRAAPRIADIGTGSGCIAIAAASRLTSAQIEATDVSDRALAVARANADRHRVADRIEFVLGDLYSALQRSAGAFDAIVSNPPYIREAEWDALQPEVRYEPRLALAGGTDGLSVYRRLAADGWRWLKLDGVLALEVGAGQAASVGDLFVSTGRYRHVRTIRDAADIERVVCFSPIPRA